MVRSLTDRRQSLWSATAQRRKYPTLAQSKTVDFAIIGGGYTGCSAALHAASEGARVALLEAGEVGNGGSGRNVGLVNAGLWLSPKRVENQMGKSSGSRLNNALMHAPDIVFSLIESQKIDCDAVRNGTLQCAHSRAGERGLRERAKQINERGGAVSILTASEARSRVGTDQILGALFDPAAGTLHPLKYGIGLAAAAENAGADIYENSAAIRVERRDEYWRVQTQHGSIDAARLLVATNAYAQGMAGCAKPQFVPVHYFQLATEPLSDNLRGDILRGNEGCWDTAKVMSSYRFDAQGRLVLGSVGSLGQGRIRTDWARRKIARFFPKLESVSFDFAWHGKIAMVSGHIPKIIELGPNGYSVFGYSGRGIGPGTVFGKMCAQALIGEDPAELPMLPQRAHQEQLRFPKSMIYQWGANAILSADCRF